MRLSTFVVSSTFLLAGLSAAFPIEGESKLMARSADSDLIEARAYTASRDPPFDFHRETDYSHNHKSTSHHPRSFYEQSHSELTRRRDPPLPPGFPYVKEGGYARNLDRWDTRRQYASSPPRPPSPSPSPGHRPSSPPRSPSPSHHKLTRRRDPPLPPGFPSGDWVRHLDAWDTRREHQNRPPSPRPTSPSPPPSPRHRRAFHDLD